MTLNMNWKEATFSAVDVVKIATYILFGLTFLLTMNNQIGNLRDDVGDIRATQIENTKKSDLRWQVIEAKQQQLELSQRLLEQRMDAIDKK